MGGGEEKEPGSKGVCVCVCVIELSAFFPEFHSSKSIVHNETEKTKRVERSYFWAAESEVNRGTVMFIISITVIFNYEHEIHVLPW